MNRPVLVGMNNPYPSPPEYALYPSPENSTGHRIYEMLKAAAGTDAAGVARVSRRNYCERFDRMNVLEAQQWDRQRAKYAGIEIVGKLNARMPFANVLIFGRETMSAMCLDRPACPPILTWQQYPFGMRWAWAPHPSGRNRWYSNPFNASQVGQFLWDMHRDAN